MCCPWTKLTPIPAKLSISRAYQLGVKAISAPSAPGAVELLLEAQQLQGVIAHADRTIALTGIAGTKYLLEKTQGYGGLTRRPLLPLEKDAQEAIWSHPDVVELIKTETDLALSLPSGL